MAVRLLSLLLASASEPADPVLVLSWQGAPDCPDALVVRERLEDAIAGATGTIVVDARVVDDDGGVWRLWLDVRGPAGEGTRELTGSSCAAVIDGAAVVVGIAARDVAVPAIVEPPAVDRSAPAEVSPVRGEPATPGIAPPQPVSRERTTGWGVRLGGALDLGMLPRMGGTVRAGIGPVWRRAELTIGFLHAAARERDAGALSGTFAITAGSVRAGPVLRRGGLRFGGLAGVELGGLRARGAGVPKTHDRSLLWVAAEGGIELGWAFTRAWSIGLAASLVLPMNRWAFAIGEDQLGAIGPVGGRIGLSLAYERVPARTRRGRADDRVPPLRIPAGGGQP